LNFLETLPFDIDGVKQIKQQSDLTACRYFGGLNVAIVVVQVGDFICNNNKWDV